MTDSLLLGAVADDLTGAADLASMLSTGGVRTALCLDAKNVTAVGGGMYEAVVVALKTRSIEPEDACARTLEALEALRLRDARQIYFKYCSTFDSSARGNIGPVTSALLKALQAPFAVAVPALPVNGRTQYLGHLFVGDRLLSETHMRDHPIHPMTDSNLVRHLQAQMRERVGLIAYGDVRQGAAAIRRAMDRLVGDETSVALVDAITDEDLVEIAEAVVDHRLVTGGSGLGGALAQVWRRRGLMPTRTSPGAGELDAGNVLILCGSCSAATLEQLSELRHTCGPGVMIDVVHLVEDFSAEVDRVYRAVRHAVKESGWACAFSSADAAQRKRTGAAAMDKGFPGDVLARRIEAAHRELASRAVADGLIRHIVVAGGETAGAVAEGLDLGALEVADVLDPGVPVLRPVVGPAPPASPLHSVTYKSGNFGGHGFFSRALRRFGLPAQEEAA